MAKITFHFWYKLSESLYQKNDNEVLNIFKPYIERLIGALCHQCQMKPDHVNILIFFIILNKIKLRYLLF